PPRAARSSASRLRPACPSSHSASRAKGTVSDVTSNQVTLEEDKMLAQPQTPDRGATPQMPAALRRRAVLRLVRSFTSPLSPDDYLELINPLWSTRELRGRVERVTRETADAATVLIKPGWEWPGHRAGQYVRLGVEVDGVHHWRAYSLTSA